jgi:hypothetical protein
MINSTLRSVSTSTTPLTGGGWNGKGNERCSSGNLEWKWNGTPVHPANPSALRVRSARPARAPFVATPGEGWAAIGASHTQVAPSLAPASNSAGIAPAPAAGSAWAGRGFSSVLAVAPLPSAAARPAGPLTGGALSPPPQ